MLSSGELEVRFGTVFTVNPDRKLGQRPERVVVGLGDGYCVSTDLYLAGTGKEALMPTGIGTTGRIHIEEVVGYWSLTQVLAAFKEGYFDNDLRLRSFWGRLEDNLRCRLTEELQKPHILLGRSVPLL